MLSFNISKTLINFRLNAILDKYLFLPGISLHNLAPKIDGISQSRL